MSSNDLDVAARCARLATMNDARARRFHIANPLERLPRVLRSALAFDALAWAFGFPASAVTFEELSERALWMRGNRYLLVAHVAVGDRSFRYLVDDAVLDVARALAEARALWDEADDATRAEFLAASPLFLPAPFRNVLHGMESARAMPLAPLDVVIPRLRTLGVPEASIELLVELVGRHGEAPGRPAPPSALARNFEIGTLVARIDPDRIIETTDIAALVARHAAGDWGVSAFADANEEALWSGRPVMSVFAVKGGTIQIATSARRTYTTITASAYSGDVRPDVRCEYVETGYLPAGLELHRAFRAPLDGRGGYSAPDDEEAAALALMGKLAELRIGSTCAVTSERSIWSIWRAVRGVDFRPIDRGGKRIAGNSAAWADTRARCGFDAWFAIDPSPHE